MRNTYVSALKQTLIEEEDFGLTFQKFFRLSEQNQGGFMQQGKRQHNEMVATMLGVGLGRLYGLKKQVELVKLLILFLKGDAMYHGACFCNGHIVSFFYFSDIDRGMISSTKMGGGGMVDYLRVQSLVLSKEEGLKGDIHNN